MSKLYVSGMVAVGSRKKLVMMQALILTLTYKLLSDRVTRGYLASVNLALNWQVC